MDSDEIETKANYIHLPEADYAQEAKQQAWQQIQGNLARETPVQRLERKKAETLKEVARLDELIGLLRANPETERILQLLGVGV